MGKEKNRRQFPCRSDASDFLHFLTPTSYQMSMFGSSVGSIHSDLLEALPDSDEQRANLVEEVKRRAKGSIQQRNFPEAIQLYAKAIEVITTIDNYGKSILFSNRSLCHHNMNNFTSALEDADESIASDSTYVKAYFRKSSALIGLGRLQQAKDAISQGLALKPDDKEMLKQLSKVDGDLQKQSAAPTKTAPKSSGTAKPKAAAGKPKGTPSAEKPIGSSPSEAATKEEDNEDDEDVSAEKIRGYKRTSDGKLTTFFNHELDEKTKSLIGDIAPKKIELKVEQVASTDDGASVWNTAGTFESRDLTPWATDRLTAALKAMSCSVPDGGDCAVKEVKDVTGDASINFKGGKRKPFCDMSATVNWEMSLPGSKLEGSIALTDITADGDFEIEVTVPARKSTDVAVKPAVIAAVKKILKNCATETLTSFIAELKAK